MEKNYYHDLLIPELIRYAKLQQKNPEQLDECGAAVFSVWYTQNASMFPEREIFCNFEEPAEPIVYDKKSALAIYGNVRLGETPKPKRRSSNRKKGIRFTVHTHTDEPLVPSPDDLVIYHHLDTHYGGQDNGGDIVNFIVDGYLCRKADPSEES